MISDTQLNAIVDRVVAKIAGDDKQNSTPPNPVQAISREPKKPINKLGAFPDIDSALAAAEKAYWEYKNTPIKQRNKFIEAIREICMENLETISRLAVEETKMGRYEDKIVKNRLAISKTPGVEDLEPLTYTGDDGLTLFERAPWGVVGSITPCTNPTETIICNGIGMIAAGNAVTFNVHPTAKNTSIFVIDLLNKAILSEGGPANLFTTITNPTIQSAQDLMKHPKVKLLVVTGGPAVVDAAMKSGKKVIGAGPGNPPVVVDDTADIDKAAKDIVTSASTDNNIICVIEKEIIATKGIADKLKEALVKHGAYEMSQYQAKRLEKIIIDGKYPNKKYVGKDVQVILDDIGVKVESNKKMAFAEVSKDHPFATVEMLMPVLPFIRVKDIDEAIETAYELEQGCFHTSVIHSKNIDHMHKMACKMNTSIFVKNGPALAGLGIQGEGPTSFTIASPTGEGVTTARHFTRTIKCVLSGHFRIV
ncbi:MAG: aldehyde dehydrogenase EutE [Bacteriovoracaceae bacterium]|nr:aldehyde dehydrogenase EutE [Bacteriovoracaceae bacterium]